MLMLSKVGLLFGSLVVVVSWCVFVEEDRLLLLELQLACDRGWTWVCLLVAPSGIFSSPLSFSSCLSLVRSLFLVQYLLVKPFNKENKSGDLVSRTRNTSYSEHKRPKIAPSIIHSTLPSPER